MPKVNVNKVAAERCPACGKMRPPDWFERDGGACWKCRALGTSAPVPARRPDAADELIG